MRMSRTIPSHVTDRPDLAPLAMRMSRCAFGSIAPRTKDGVEDAAVREPTFELER
jgi:hypothetical protein